MNKPAIAYEAPVLIAPKNPGSRFARLGAGGVTPRRPAQPLAYEVREGVPLAELEPRSCRWPVGTPGAGLFCGCRTTAPARYCADHADKSRLRPVEPREVDEFVAMGMRLAHGGRRS